MVRVLGIYESRWTSQPSQRHRHESFIEQFVRFYTYMWARLRIALSGILCTLCLPLPQGSGKRYFGLKNAFCVVFLFAMNILILHSILTCTHRHLSQCSKSVSNRWLTETRENPTQRVFTRIWKTLNKSEPGRSESFSSSLIANVMCCNPLSISSVSICR
jgi:hypothetical protein